MASISSQNVQWSGEYKEKGHYQLLTEREGMLYMSYHKTYTPLHQRDKDMSILKVDASTLDLVKDREIVDLENHDYFSIQTVTSAEGLAHIYFHKSKKKQWEVSAQLYDYNTLDKKNVVELVKFDILKSNKKLSIDVNEEDSHWPYGLMLSEDLSKMAVYNYEEKVGKEKNTLLQYAVIDLRDSLQVLYQGEYLTDRKSKYYKIKDMHLADNGALYFVEKAYKDDRDKEYDGKKPSYMYSVVKMSGDTTDYIYDISPKSDFMDDVKIGTGKNGEVFAAAYLSEKPRDDRVGLYFLSLDQYGYKVAETRTDYSAREIKKIRGKEKKDLNREYKVVDVIANDDIVYVIKQYRDNERIRSGLGQGAHMRGNITWNAFYYDNLVVEAIDPKTCELLWIAVNPRDNMKMEDFINPFMISTQFALGDNLYIMYNDKIENLERIKAGKKVKGLSMPGGKTVQVIAKIDKSGKVNYKALERKEEKKYVAYKGMLIGESDMYFVGSKRFRGMKIGKIPFSSIK